MQRSAARGIKFCVLLFALESKHRNHPMLFFACVVSDPASILFLMSQEAVSIENPSKS